LALQGGFPEKAVLPGVGDSLRLGAVGLMSFAAQVMINRAFRLETAMKMATMSLTQVRSPSPHNFSTVEFVN
jgi:hypothetical protein